MAKSEQDNSSNVKEGVRELKRLLPYLWTQKGILLLGLFCMIISIVMNFSVGIFIRYVIDDFPQEPVAAVSFLDSILIFGLIYIVVSAVVGYLTGYNFRKVAANVTRDIRSGIFEQLINKDLNYLDQQSSGDMQTRVVADTSAVGRFLADQIPTIVAGGLTLIVGIIGALYISVKLTLIVLFCLPFIFVPLAIFSPKLRRYGRLLQTAISDIGTFAGETFRNIKIVRAYSNEVVENNRFAKLCNQAVTYILERSKLELGMSVIVNAMALSGFAVLLWSSGKDIVSGAMSIGELVAFAYFALMILQSGGRFLRIGAVISVAVGTSKKVLEYLADEKHAWPSAQEGVVDDTNIEFKAVSFSYPIRPDVQVLDNVDFKIDRGTHVALVGPSGAGKSTIFELLLSLYDSYEGEILIGGVNARSLDVVQLRSIFGYVPQQESLVTGTVNDNISYGNGEASDEQIVEAAKMAHAHEFIEKLPKGYETDLGEVGDRLSGGQKQRIALARALIRKPKILLLDEAKSALDAASERLVADAIEVWANGQNATVFSIAHQLETVRTANLIIVVNDGVIVDKGSHRDLLQRCDLYKKLSAMGFDDEAAEAVNE